MRLSGLVLDLMVGTFRLCHELCCGRFSGSAGFGGIWAGMRRVSLLGCGGVENGG